MTTDDQARYEAIEQDMNERSKFGAEPYLNFEDARFLLDLARTADAMLRTAFLDHGLDVDALLAEAEQRVVMKCRELCLSEAKRWAESHGMTAADQCTAHIAAIAITAAYNLPPLEEPGR